MPNKISKPLDPYLAQPALAKRKNVTKACDRCRRRRIQCDAQKPACSSCHRANHECISTHTGLKRGRKTTFANQDPATPWTTFQSSDVSSTDSQGTSLESSTYRHFAAMDPFSREVTDHLVELFFVHCFQDYDFFSPVDFLRQYIQGTANQDLLYAMCASAARLSDHPAVAKTPPSSNGQVYVDYFRTRMMDLMTRTTIDVSHTLLILAHANYNSGHAQKAVRIEAMAIAMLPELGLHLIRPPAPGKPFKSEAERIAFEIDNRTCSALVTYDWVATIACGVPGMLEHIETGWPHIEFRQDWWIERMPTTGGQRMEALDDYSIRILHRIHKPRRLRGVDFDIHMRRLVVPGQLVRKFCQSMSSLGARQDQSLEGRQGIDDGADSTTTANITASRRLDIQEVYQQAENALEQWRENLPQGQEPCRAKDMVSQLEPYGFLATAYYYTLVIQLHRPYLLQACMSISVRKKRLTKGPGDLGGKGVEEEEEELRLPVDQTELQIRESCLSKCLAAADEITATIGQFTDEDIKYRGYAFAFPVFIAGTVYVIQRIVNENASKEVQPDKDKLAICRRFLQTLGRYYASAADEDFLLDRLSSTNAAGSGEGKSGNSSNSIPAMEMMSDMVLSAPSMDADEINDFEMLWSDGLPMEEKEVWQMMSPIDFIPPVCKDDHGAVEEKVGGEGDGDSVVYMFPQPVVLDSVDATFLSATRIATSTTSTTVTTATTATTATTGTRSETTRKDDRAGGQGHGAEEKHAFFTTDSGLGTLWMHPEKMASLEEATISSFEKLSVLDRTNSQGLVV